MKPEKQNPPPLADGTAGLSNNSDAFNNTPLHDDEQQARSLSGAPASEPEKEKKSASTILVELAMQSFTFGVSTNGETFAIPKRGSKVVSMLRGAKTSLRGQLARLYFQQQGRAAPQQALADALLVIEGMAQESEEVELYLRVARHHHDLWLDLGDDTGRAVRVTSAGWTIEEPPMLFKRTALMGALPEPERGGSLDELWEKLNVTKADRPLVAAWLATAMYFDCPHPVLSLFGEQGTGKTTAAKMLVAILDPGPVPIRKPPRDSESWVTAAAGSWVVALDNLSDVQPWLSDSICRAVTGDGDVRRKLYTDGEHSVFSFRRAIILNSIDLGGNRGDLAERMLPIHLEVIPDSERMAEAEIWPSWKKAHPRILGALLDLVAGINAALPSVELANKPRMADFAKVLAAADMVIGTSGLSHYLAKQTALATDSLSGDPFMVEVLDKLDRPFEGTASDLLLRLTPEKPPRGWPNHGRSVTTRLKRHSPALRKSGWTVSSIEDEHRKVTIWSIAPPEMVRNSPPQYPQAPQAAPFDDEGTRYLWRQANGQVGGWNVITLPVGLEDARRMLSDKTGTDIEVKEAS